MVLELVSDPTGAALDIVFVHGLCGGQRETWSLGHVCWPKDILPAILPNARVLLFGHNANSDDFWGPPLQNRIKHHSEQFSQEMIQFRSDTETNERPIAFISHSVGGLLCAQAILSLSVGNSGQRNLASRTRFLVFYGTPLMASDSTWKLIVQSFMNYSDYVGPDFTDAPTFSETAKQLSTLGTEFSEYMERRRTDIERSISIQCFHEGKSTRIPGVGDIKIVPETSACLQGFTHLEIPASHAGMCKLSGKDDDKYQIVKSFLQEWAKQLEEVNDASSTVYKAAATFSGYFFGTANAALVTDGGHLQGGSVTFGATTFQGADCNPQKL